MNFRKIGIAGAGSWGTALAVLLSDRGIPITLWGHDPEHVNSLTLEGENRIYLPGVKISGNIRATASLSDLSDADAILLVTPSRATRGVVEKLLEAAPPIGTVLISCTKGIEQGTGLRMSQIISKSFPQNPVAVLSGPSHAEEVSRQMPTAVVIGASEEAIAHALQQTFSSKYFRAYTSDDIAGIELGGALKNIFAIAAGLSDGIGFGDNSKSALVTRSLAELIRLGVALGGRRETFQGLSGIGDLIVTCFSRHSRNRAFGERLGRGESAGEIQKSMKMVAEGVPTTLSAFECARRLNISTPITDQLYGVIYENKSPREAMQQLLTRDPRPEEDKKRDS